MQISNCQNTHGSPWSTSLGCVPRSFQSPSDAATANSAFLAFLFTTFHSKPARVERFEAGQGSAADFRSLLGLRSLAQLFSLLNAPLIWRVDWLLSGPRLDTLSSAFQNRSVDRFGSPSFPPLKQKQKNKEKLSNLKSPKLYFKQAGDDVDGTLLSSKTTVQP